MEMTKGICRSNFALVSFDSCRRALCGDVFGHEYHRVESMGMDVVEPFSDGSAARGIVVCHWIVWRWNSCVEEQSGYLGVDIDRGSVERARPGWD